MLGGANPAGLRVTADGRGKIYLILSYLIGPTRTGGTHLHLTYSRGDTYSIFLCTLGPGICPRTHRIRHTHSALYTRACTDRCAVRRLREDVPAPLVLARLVPVAVRVRLQFAVCWGPMGSNGSTKTTETRQSRSHTALAPRAPLTNSHKMSPVLQ